MAVPRLARLPGKRGHLELSAQLGERKKSHQARDCGGPLSVRRAGSHHQAGRQRNRPMDGARRAGAEGAYVKNHGGAKATCEQGGWFWSHDRGISLGCPLSPLIGAFFLGELDARMERSGLFYVRFMDDILVLAPSCAVRSGRSIGN